MRNKLTSRKFILAVSTALLILFSAWTQRDLDVEHMATLIADVVGYMFAEAYVDAHRKGR
jgi:hypothetical protein